MENYSGFLNHTDEQVGRLIGAVERSGEMDNTSLFLGGWTMVRQPKRIGGTLARLLLSTAFSWACRAGSQFDEIGVQRLIRTFPWVGLGGGHPFNGPSNRLPLRWHPERVDRSLAKGIRARNEIERSSIMSSISPYGA